jgi:hypothetical protein
MLKLFIILTIMKIVQYAFGGIYPEPATDILTSLISVAEPVERKLFDGAGRLQLRVCKFM